ncbi:MAG: hypothetical protein DI586_07030 [Micavibrio aeruginosavorus]|uniref:Copper chaperone PCu(A)C n=1 Tax=Micavibrio aeruginosavorus TaxID=349221 RepID=A0A2W5FJH4_9BACT|nr:MAG: hypothetical protein DI586_07030 [Micavibrio aeruginosavorus]
MKSLLLTAALLCLTTPAFADIQVTDVRAFETSEGMKNGAVLLTLKNTGKEDDKIISASTLAADQTEIHEMLETDGVMKMREVGAITIKAGEEVAFKPDGYHIMLLGLKEPLKAGNARPLTLKFLRASEIKTTVEVISRSTKKETGHSAHHGHH